MWKKIALAALVFTLPTVTIAAQRSMKEMHGNCGNYALNLTQELTLWKSVAVPTKPGARVELAKKLLLELIPQSETQLKLQPEQSFPAKAGGYAGAISFVAPETGSYRISAGAKVWLELAEEKSLQHVEASSFEMQTGCDQIFKVVSFSLSAGRSYVLQASSSKEKQLLLAITRNPSL